VQDEALTAEIIAAYRALSGNPGVRRMWAHLTVAGHRISPKRVHRLMKAADLYLRRPVLRCRAGPRMIVISEIAMADDS